MYPSLLAEETKRAVTEYLSTTFALADDEARAALESFLLDRETGIIRGPYLRAACFTFPDLAPASVCTSPGWASLRSC